MKSRWIFLCSIRGKRFFVRNQDAKLGGAVGLDAAESHDVTIQLDTRFKEGGKGAGGSGIRLLVNTHRRHLRTSSFGYMK